jgi:hypothetical protein
MHIIAYRLAYYSVLFSPLPKNGSRLIKSPACLSLSVCLSACPPLITFEQLGIFNEIWYGGKAIQGDLHAVMFIPTASIILKILRFKVVR